MTWKPILVVLIVVSGFFGMLAYLAHEDTMQQGQWLDFVQRHHCSMIPTSWNHMQVWQCDGFQVEHN